MKKFITNITKKFSSPRFLSGVLMVGMMVVVCMPIGVYADPLGTCTLASGNNMPNLVTLTDCNTFRADDIKNGKTGGGWVADTGGAQGNSVTPGNAPKPSSSIIQDVAEGAINTIIGNLLIVVMALISGLLGLAGLVLDYVIKLSVTDLASNINSIAGINVAWRLIRDLCNMSFIFILLYYAIMMVFGQKDARKIIVPIIIAALLINFSLFFTKIIIDASNIITVSFYNSISQATGPSIVLGVNNTNTFSGAFMKSLNLSSIYSSSIKVPAGNSGVYITQIIGSALFMLIACFIFLAMAVLFIIRYLTFILLLIMSPFGYVASAIPGLNGLSKKYWETLTGQALFAPIFMIMIWITLTLASSFTMATGTSAASLGAAFSNPSSTTIGTMVNFILLAGLLIYSLIISKSYATQGGIVSGKIVGAGMGMAGGALFGGASYLGTRSFGKLGTMAANNDSLREAASKKGVAGSMARLSLKTAQTAQSSSFDARNISGFGKATDFIGAGSFGKKGNAPKGYKGVLDDKQKAYNEADKKRAEGLKVTDTVADEAKKKLDKEKTLKEENAKNLDNEIDLKKKQNNDLTQEITNLEKDLKKAVTPRKRARNKGEIYRLQTVLEDKRSTISESREKLAQIEKNKTNLDTDFNAREDIKKLIKDSGGDKDKKISSTSDDRINSYANTVGDQKTRNFVIFNPEFNKERARKIRKLAKTKSTKETLEELLKENGDIKKDDKKEETPVAEPKTT